MTTMTESTWSEGGVPGDSSLVWIDRLLRDRPALITQIRSGDDLSGLARVMILTVLVAGGAFGASLGAYRGGWQILFAGIKLPLVLLLTVGVCGPALTAVRRVLLGHGDVRRDLALALSSLALASLIQAACVPVIVLATTGGAGYHSLILLAAGVYGVSGLIGLSLLGAGIRSGQRFAERLAVLIMVITFSVVAAQMAWCLRPYLVRPRTPQPPVVRAIEGNAFDAVSTSWSSAFGYYSRSEAPLPSRSDVPRPARTGSSRAVPTEPRPPNLKVTR